jgi:uncharacterized protein YjiS (DUF1127 family)
MADSLVQHWSAPRPRRGLGGLFSLPRLWIKRASWRAELANLDTLQMRDCGLDPLMVHREAIKPFWRE